MSSHSSSNLIRLAPHSEVVTVPVAEYYVVSWKYFWLLVMVSRICWESLEFFRQVAWAKGGQEKWLETHPWFRKGFVWLKCVAVPCLPFDPLFILCNFLCKGKLRAFYRQVSSTDSSFPSALAIYNKRVSFPKKETQSEIQQTKTDQHIYGRKSTTTGCVCVCVFLRFLTRIFGGLFVGSLNKPWGTIGFDDDHFGCINDTSAPGGVGGLGFVWHTSRSLPPNFSRNRYIPI